MVFEDPKSGEEMGRTHTGRTRRLYSETPHTESGFLTAGDEAAGEITEPSFSAAREARLLAVEDYDRTISEPRKTKSKQSGWYRTVLEISLQYLIQSNLHKWPPLS